MEPACVCQFLIVNKDLNEFFVISGNFSLYTDLYSVNIHNEKYINQGKKNNKFWKYDKFDLYNAPWPGSNLKTLLTLKANKPIHPTDSQKESQTALQHDNNVLTLWAIMSC